MCLPHCPTYNATQLESESPRGRIAIIQGLIDAKISNTQQALAHINNCLSCRACEKICPSNVRYGALLDQFKSNQQKNVQPAKQRFIKSSLRFVLLHPKINAAIVTVAKLFRLNALLGLTNTGLSNKRNIYKPNKSNYPTTAKQACNNNNIALFIGCTGSSLDKQTLNDILYVLNIIGYNVSVSRAATCCGALDAHAGREQSALQLASNNITAFNNLNADSIVYFATGCGAQLSEYHQLNWPTKQQHDSALQFTKKLFEITKFIELNWPKKITLKHSNLSIAIHEPCTHRNVLQESDSAAKLFSHIKNIKIITLNDNKFCCGAAGDYMFTHQTAANNLRAPKLKEIKQLKPDRVLTTNIGCALHLRKGLHHNKQSVPVMHPISLLAELIVND